MGIGGEHWPASLMTGELGPALLEQSSVAVWLTNWTRVGEWLATHGITDLPTFDAAIEAAPSLLEQLPTVDVEAASPVSFALFGATDLADLNRRLIGQRPTTTMLRAYLDPSRQHLQGHINVDGAGGARHLLFSWLLRPSLSQPFAFTVGLDTTERMQVEQKLAWALGEVTRLRAQLAAENDELRRRMRQLEGSTDMIGESAGLEQVREEIRRVAATRASVLIRGETGTGKELVADAIHAMSDRADRPFVKINCAAVATELVESELFGHVRGAFTGAIGDRLGAFVVADGGTLFLDELGELPLGAQAKLLRVLQNGEVQPVGASATRRVDVRILAATNRNLEAEVERGAFRNDLYYRVAVFPIDVPALRERQGDIIALAEYFGDRIGKRYGLAFGGFDDTARTRLLHYRWPGNVRELSNVIERAVIGRGGGRLSAEDLRLPALSEAVGQTHVDQTLDEAMTGHILHVLEATRWRIGGPGGAAETLDLNESTLRARMRKLGIRRPE